MLVQFQREKLKVNGVDVVMLTAGEGEPLMFWHGAGTWSEFDFAEPWTKHFKVMIPYHPGWGESGDAPYDTVQDYMMHYVDLLDQLGLKQVNLVGLSMGGRFAATFAYEHRPRVKKLALVCPAGLDVPEYPLTDFSRIHPAEIPAYLVHNLDAIAHHLPASPGPEWQATRAREGGNFAKLLATGLIGGNFPRWLHRITMPALLVWGEMDRTIPFRQTATWMKLLPNAKLQAVAEAGHLVLDEKPESVEAIAQFFRLP